MDHFDFHTNGQVPSAVIVPPGRSMNRFLRPNVAPELARQPVNLKAAEREYQAYLSAFRSNGVHVYLLHEHCEHFANWRHSAPDSVFPEDVARPVLDRVSGGTVLLKGAMNTESRCKEPDQVVRVLLEIGAFRREQCVNTFCVNTEARFEAGDIIQLYPKGQEPVILFGLSERSNEAGFSVMQEVCRARKLGRLYGVRVSKRSLHLTTGAGKPDNETLLYDPTLVSEDDLLLVPGIKLIEVDHEDRGQLNCPNVVFFPTSKRVLMDDRFPSTIRKMENEGFAVDPLPNLEHAKGAGGLSCRSLRWNWHSSH